MQHGDGGWGWWENDDTHPFMTAYVVNGLDLAEKAGYSVGENMLSDGKSALKDFLKNTKDSDPTTLAYQFMVAMQAGMDGLWDGKRVPLTDSLNAYQASLWLQAAYFAKDKTTQEKLLNKLTTLAITEGASTYWGGKKFYYSWQDDRVETTANAVKAISLIDPEHELLPAAIQWLMIQRKGNSWHNTRQTAMIIHGLSEIIKLEQSPDLEVGLMANGRKIADLRLQEADVYEKGKTYRLHGESFTASAGEGTTDPLAVLQNGKNTLSIQQKGKGRLYVNARLRYFVDKENSQEVPKSESFEVERKYFKLEEQQDRDGKLTYRKVPLKKAEILSGDDLLVKVRIKVKSEQEYLLMEDPIPAGCEFIRDTDSYIIKGEEDYNGSTERWGWGYWDRWYTHSEYRDNRYALTVTKLNKGEFEYSYLLKAQIPGTYNLSPAVTQLMYYPEVRGFSEFTELKIGEQEK